MRTLWVAMLIAVGTLPGCCGSLLCPKNGGGTRWMDGCSSDCCGPAKVSPRMCGGGCGSGCGPCGGIDCNGRCRIRGCGWWSWNLFGRWRCCFRGCHGIHGGCGDTYWGDYQSDPPDCIDPCDRCGHYVGPHHGGHGVVHDGDWDEGYADEGVVYDGYASTIGPNPHSMPNLEPTPAGQVAAASPYRSRVRAGTVDGATPTAWQTQSMRR